MSAFSELLACPACGGALQAAWVCARCGARFDEADGVLNLRLPADARTDAVRAFYDAAPFPGYPPGESLDSLRAKAERHAFTRLLDRAIPPDARVVDIGCGTGQLCLYLAHAGRMVVGADLTRASLVMGAAAAARFAIDRVRFVETDLRRPGLARGAFDVVYSSGVLHHTPDPRRSFAAVAALARPGGIIVVGLYNRFARVPSRARKIVARLSGYRVVPFDPVLRDRGQDEARRDAWLRDQYRHPEEHTHTIADVQRWFAENDVEYLRTYPSAVWGDESSDLFAPAEDNWRFEGWFAQLGWMRTLGREGGLFFTIGARRAAGSDRRSQTRGRSHFNTDPQIPRSRKSVRMLA